MNNQEQKHHDRETEGYKAFMPIARKIKKMDYDAKWRIVPDMTDPLRRFTLERDIAWATIKVQVYMKNTYHRGVYDWESRYDWKPMLSVTGLYADQREPQVISLGMAVKPRMAKKVIEAINLLIPKFYDSIKVEEDSWKARKVHDKEFDERVKSVEGLRIIEKIWDGHSVSLEGCPFFIKLNETATEATLQCDLTLKELSEMSKKMGWGK